MRKVLSHEAMSLMAVSHTAHDKISWDALWDYIAELEAERRWIPVSERLPELDQDVLAIVEGDIVTGHFYQQWDGEIYFSSDDEGAMMVATHWMPLPQPPKVQQ